MGEMEARAREGRLELAGFLKDPTRPSESWVDLATHALVAPRIQGLPDGAQRPQSQDGNVEASLVQ